MFIQYTMLGIEPTTFKTLVTSITTRAGLPPIVIHQFTKEIFLRRKISWKIVKDGLGREEKTEKGMNNLDAYEQFILRSLLGQIQCDQVR